MTKYGVIGLLMVILGLAALTTYHYYSQYVAVQEKLASAQAITRNALTTLNLMYDIAKVTHEDKQKLVNEGETRVVYIRDALKNDECAYRDVAPIATDNLRLLENRVRAGKPAETAP